MPVIFTSFGIESILFFNFDFTETGQIGDTIGGITTPLLTAIAAVYAYKTYSVQQEELSLQRDEMKNQTSEFEKENETIKLEVFENRLFKMIDQQQKLTDAVIKERSFENRYLDLCEIYNYFTNRFKNNSDFIITFRSVSPNISRLVYDIYYYGIDSLKKRFPNNSQGNDYDDQVHQIYCISKKLVSKGMPLLSNYFMTSRNETLGVYYRNLFLCINYIDKSSNLTDAQKQEYVNIVCCQLSDYARLMLYYYTLSSEGKLWLEDNYLEKYKILSACTDKIEFVIKF
jgi:hypothetical protein